MSAGDIAAWLIETTLALSLLIAVILLIRRPVARWFGSEAAYVLWLAPLARLALPDLRLLPAPGAVDAAPSMMTLALADTPSTHSVGWKF